MNKNRRNYYRILQAQPDASQEAIKNNYRTLLQKLRLHPDLGGEDWNASLINKAYSILRHPVKRAAYDRELLSQHHISTLSQGHLSRSRASVKTHERLFSKDGRGNKRNYYPLDRVKNTAGFRVGNICLFSLSCYIFLSYSTCHCFIKYRPQFILCPLLTVKVNIWFYIKFTKRVSALIML